MAAKYRQAKEGTMTEWNDPSAMTLTFQVEASEDMKAFFDRMQKESKEKEEAYKERIRQLFNEHINIDGEAAVEFYNKILQVFAIGYQCGWNDHYSLFTNMWKPSDEQMLALEAKITIPPQSPAMTSALIELYQQLKKLRELNP